MKPNKTLQPKNSSPKRKRYFKVFHIGSNCNRDCCTLINLFFYGAVEVSLDWFSGVSRLHQGITGGKVTGVEVSAKRVTGAELMTPFLRPNLASQFRAEIQVDSPMEERTHKPV